MDSISTPLASLGSVVGWAYVIFVPLLWFFGIHGSLALTALDSGIMTPWALENISIYQQFGSVDAALEAGKTFHVWAKPMLDSYIFLGGSGATLGLIIAIFTASRRPDYRQVAKLALPSGLFQINEPILFGLPIIMNPVMFIPFIWCNRYWRRLRWQLITQALFHRLPTLHRGPCQPVWARSLTPTVVSLLCWSRCSTSVSQRWFTCRSWW